MQAPAVRYDRWNAPAEDGKLLIWPASAELLEDTRNNQRRLSGADSILIQNVPLSDVRCKMREWLGHPDFQPLIAAGHQAELHHPGVWAKNALVDAAAKKLGGRAYYFAVDTDEPKHLVLRWPGGAIPLTDDPEALSREWSGLVAPPTPAHLAEIERQFNQAASQWGFAPLVDQFIASMRRSGMEARALPPVLTDSLHQLDWDLGLRHDAMLVSPICFSPPYLLLAYHILARAAQFGADYNAVLDEHRRDNRIKAPGRPMPNLKIDDDSREVPFWLDAMETGQRRRATVVRFGDQWGLRLAGGEEFRFFPEMEGWRAAEDLMLWLRRFGMRLSPRALTLTAVLRLLVADQFVHGIGGGQYDQVLDALIARHLRFEPPQFSVTTATLYFPTAVDQPRVCLPCLVQEGHRLKHGVLGGRKMELVRQIESLPRRSPQRSALFVQMHDLLSAAWTTAQVRTWEQTFRAAEEQHQRQRVLFDRELFYAIQPRDRLVALIDRYRAELK